MKPTPHSPGLSRRQALAGAGTTTAALLLGASTQAAAETPSAKADDFGRRVAETPFIDTHEHLVEESRRLEGKPGGPLPCNDWGLLFSHYVDSDLLVAGMPQADYRQLVSPEVAEDAKWPLLEPWWPLVQNTGYGQAVQITLRDLYGVEHLDGRSIRRVADGYRSWIKPGFYARVLRETARIESCQVNSLEAPFQESQQPDLLMQDLSLMSFSPFGGSGWTWMTDRDGQKATDLAGYHRVIDHYFDRYGPYAVAVKTQVAYARALDFADVPAEQAAAPFQKLLNKEPVTDAERKLADDHLFWYGVRRATQHGLPVKLHTGYYAGHNSMPLARVAANPADVSVLLRRSRDTTFVLMHIGYPYQEEMLAVAKHYPNAVIDMCWAWIINPAASERFLRDFLVTAPSNKILTFGGDYIPVECVVGHAALARHGLARTLRGLAADGWLDRANALDLVEPLMRGNARKLFRVDEKLRALERAPWRSKA